ncbi:hypothetical protein CYLTODRAFT_490399 [Cylindrobasidium torrendii FP15055 ss-10]|uniref:Uncharacterized protein n=1 Tax=Cylindrobasidium torrendii FP15055 ss-10 TaxID=1314674 RepID=A0A0D7BDR6_9AGAR|nr:hypothetical protein CYLTODRAFT_490399 [Cylindrobasidium torrendii FP15055 ss-10]
MTDTKSLSPRPITTAHAPSAHLRAVVSIVVQETSSYLRSVGIHFEYGAHPIDCDVSLLRDTAPSPSIVILSYALRLLCHAMVFQVAGTSRLTVRINVKTIHEWLEKVAVYGRDFWLKHKDPRLGMLPIDKRLLNLIADATRELEQHYDVRVNWQYASSGTDRELSILRNLPPLKETRTAEGVSIEYRAVEQMFRIARNAEFSDEAARYYCYLQHLSLEAAALSNLPSPTRVPPPPSTCTRDSQSRSPSRSPRPISRKRPPRTLSPPRHRSRVRHTSRTVSPCPTRQSTTRYPHSRNTSSTNSPSSRDLRLPPLRSTTPKSIRQEGLSQSFVDWVDSLKSGARPPPSRAVTPGPSAAHMRGTSNSPGGSPPSTREDDRLTSHARTRWDNDLRPCRRQTMSPRFQDIQGRSQSRDSSVIPSKRSLVDADYNGARTDRRPGEHIDNIRRRASKKY